MKTKISQPVHGLDIGKLVKGDRRTLAKAITLIESQRPEDSRKAKILLDQITPFSGRSLRLGITGMPGAGKSTFIENFGLYLAEKGFKIAVLPVDPSSPLSGGSILGDKTRMERLSNHPSTFIRPSPSKGVLGGIGLHTLENIHLCEAAGFDIVIVETVGVGQSEYEVADCVDLFILLTVPNAGDELQGMKKGILELVDGIIINKADGVNQQQAELTYSQLMHSMSLCRAHDRLPCEIHKVSSLAQTNFDAVYEMIRRFKEDPSLKKPFETKRDLQNNLLFKKLVVNYLADQLLNSKEFQTQRERLMQEIADQKQSVYSAASSYVESLLHDKNWLDSI